MKAMQFAQLERHNLPNYLNFPTGADNDFYLDGKHSLNDAARNNGNRSSRFHNNLAESSVAGIESRAKFESVPGLDVGPGQSDIHPSGFSARIRSDSKPQYQRKLSWGS